MIKNPIIIQLASGLEPRPVAVLVQVASQYNSKIYVEDGDRKVNAKSIMGVMALASQDTSKINVCVDGVDEEEAMKAMAGLLE